jgi:hypothetical protein
MAVIAGAAVWFPLFLVGVWAYTPTIPKTSRIIRLRPRPQLPPSSVFTAGLVITYLLLWLIARGVYDPLAGLRYALAFIAGRIVGGLWAQQRRADAVIAIIIVIFVWLALYALHEYVYAAPLPDAQLELRDQPVIIEGELVGRDGGTWFITNQPEQVIALDSDVLKQVTVTSPEPTAPRTTWDLIGDLLS